MNDLEVVRPKNAETMDADQWANWLHSRNLISINPQHAGVLVARIQSGMNYTRDMLQHETGKHFELPKLFVASAHPLLTGLAQYLTQYGLIAVSKEHLQNNALLEQGVLIDCTRATNRPDVGVRTFTGTTADLAFLIGVEETDHAAFVREHKTVEYGDLTQLTLAQYDALPIELRALERKVAVSEALAMPEITRRILAARLAAARAISGQKK